MQQKKGANSARKYSGSSSSNSSKPMILQFLKKNTHPGKRYDDVKLPVIKERKNKESYPDLLQMMKVRKRQIGGTFEEKGMSSPKN
jgi:hypothetical protein